MLFSPSLHTTLVLGFFSALRNVAAQDSGFDLDTLPRCVTDCISQVTTATGCSIDNPPCVCVQGSFYACWVKTCPANVQNSELSDKITQWCNSGNSTSTTSPTSSAVGSFTIQTSTDVTNSVSTPGRPTVTTTVSTTLSLPIPISSSALSSSAVSSLLQVSSSSTHSHPASSSTSASASATPTSNGAMSMLRSTEMVTAVGAVAVGLLGGWLAGGL